MNDSTQNCAPQMIVKHIEFRFHSAGQVDNNRKSAFVSYRLCGMSQSVEMTLNQ